MNEALAPELDSLIDEITRYLAAVEAFRAVGCEPAWRPELHAAVERSRAPATGERVPSDIRLH